ncbi:hypothetical protein MGYG_05270 [Nannizzia gypsea CBS 118893]|uniref:Uncharacterized protein n=1 Tax=Arthroderma gypseum (strain ATCC MYA-4604 / CBS 118893) TaxID=535722 RepID=E4UVE2_ARTGP|nr:hypothetical protein MGYG_05270 [Nannizzia gypsea CBS 118893]EFR02269.1 hypothetical protein MGYG_05270 [Nannizzia gypsea CBS 118893]
MSSAAATTWQGAEVQVGAETVPFLALALALVLGVTGDFHGREWASRLTVELPLHGPYEHPGCIHTYMRIYTSATESSMYILTLSFFLSWGEENTALSNAGKQ